MQIPCDDSLVVKKGMEVGMADFGDISAFSWIGHQRDFGGSPSVTYFVLLCRTISGRWVIPVLVVHAVKSTMTELVAEMLLLW